MQYHPSIIFHKYIMTDETACELLKGTQVGPTMGFPGEDIHFQLQRIIRHT